MSDKPPKCLVLSESGGVVSNETTEIIRKMMPEIIAFNPSLARDLDNLLNLLDEGSVSQMIELDTEVPVNDITLNTKRLEMQAVKLDKELAILNQELNAARMEIQTKIGPDKDVDEYIESCLNNQNQSINNQQSDFGTMRSLSFSSEASRTISSIHLNDNGVQRKSASQPFKDPNMCFPKTFNPRARPTSNQNKNSIQIHQIGQQRNNEFLIKVLPSDENAATSNAIPAVQSQQSSNHTPDELFPSSRRMKLNP